MSTIMAKLFIPIGVFSMIFELCCSQKLVINKARMSNYDTYDINGVSSLFEVKGLSMLETVYGNLSESTEWKFIWNTMAQPPLDYHIDWSSIVFIMNIYDSLKTNELISAHFDTWLKHVGEGADIVFVGDADDTRSFDEILPDADKVSATCHLYKSPAKKEGARLRYKVIDGLRHVAEKEFNSPKKYFFKMDTDTYIVPDYLLAYVNDLHEKTYPKPVLVGCGLRCEYFCHADGGFYGLNDVGINAVNQYFKEHPDLYEISQNPGFKDKRLMSSLEFGRFRQLMNNEDFMVSYAYRESTQIPVIHNPLFRTHQKGVLEKNGISFHKVESTLEFHVYNDRFYSSDGKLKLGYFDGKLKRGVS